MRNIGRIALGREVLADARGEMRFVVEGRGLSEAKVRRAVELSAEKYCSATAMMRAAGVEVSYGVEIVELD